ncbi:MAG: hypothetical protein KAI66_24430, partial [Lentisphaeria bacterium]|nr:hypothetical protein [Lentisphaeria bacterium]
MGHARQWSRRGTSVLCTLVLLGAFVLRGQAPPSLAKERKEKPQPTAEIRIGQLVAGQSLRRRYAT